MLEKFVIVILFLASGIFGYFLKTFLLQKKYQNLDLKIKSKILDAEKEAFKIVQKAEEKKNKIIDSAFREIKEKEDKNAEERRKNIEREVEINQLKKENEIKEKELLKKEKKLKNKEEYLKKKDREQSLVLEKIAKIKREEAKEILFNKIEEEYKEDLLLKSLKLKNENRLKLQEEAREIIAQAMQKYSNEVNHPLVSTVVQIENDAEKGKIIGKDGRNIRTFERLTGVQLIIDDEPEIVTISSFDPIRREIANRVLKRLLDDGIVHPGKIEEYYKIAVENVNEIIKEKGEEAVQEVGIYNLHPDLIEILGKLHFRTSYGQNVLRHSIETAHIASVIAEEIGGNVSVAKTAALLHDIGKAVDFEMDGSHVEIGRKLLKQFKVDDEIIKAMQSHHREYPNENLESYIIDTADAISASRPGARSDTAEMYLKKVQGLERIVSEFDGVLESYALSAGREVRVFVKPDVVNDYMAEKMAREIALKIEKELKYPGEIKVAVIRESKVVEYAR